MTEHVNVVVPRHTQCGEGPYWDPESRTVVWVDIIGKQALRTTIGGDTTVIDYPEMVGAAAPRVGGGLVLAVESGFALLDATGEVTSWVDVLTPPLRMNDAKVDPAGRYWAGACAMDFSEGKGGLWRLDENLSAELVLDGLTQPNGIGWSPDGTTMYLAETQARQLLSYGFDPVTSNILSGPSVVAEGFADYPDGLCVDRDGHIWLAEYGGASCTRSPPTATWCGASGSTPLRPRRVPSWATTSTPSWSPPPAWASTRRPIRSPGPSSRSPGTAPPGSQSPCSRADPGTTQPPLPTDTAVT
ncbi:SMP-30/gluconolactonase/LRE family protein [Tessaracoccus sp. HDW20]|nr:SMP-30/gluconolactonase/LRE family protein [Tessaracoccus coleopterorum]NHB84773.1 SMP-30/gluconolactonase/LRE family protein [Tessaracoccus coleopterorum]